MSTTNDIIEKWWQEYKKIGTQDRILKRFCELLERVGGYNAHGISPTPSVMDMIALDRRDRSSRTWQPRVTKDVRHRHHLAGCILIANALTELVPGKVYAVRAGVAPACILRLDLENERELIEDHGDDHKAKLLKPLHDLICKPTLDVLRASQNARDRPTTKHYLQDFTRTPPFCTCPDHTKRGGAHDACKHVKAGQKRHILSSFPLV
jgi:hypothetical protein